MVCDDRCCDCIMLRIVVLMSNLTYNVYFMAHDDECGDGTMLLLIV